VSYFVHRGVGFWLKKKTAFPGSIKPKVWETWNADPDTSDAEPPQSTQKASVTAKSKRKAAPCDDETGSEEGGSDADSAEEESGGDNHSGESDDSADDSGVDVTGADSIGGEDSEDLDVAMDSDDAESKAVQKTGEFVHFMIP
jgi:hypothetical protein